MSDWFKQLTSYIIGSLILTLLVNSWPWLPSYPSPTVEIPAPAPTVLPTMVPSEERTATFITWAYKDLADLKIQNEPKYSSSYKDKLRKEADPCWVERGDRYRVVHQDFPYAYIKVTHSDLYARRSVLWRGYLCEGWVKGS